MAKFVPAQNDILIKLSLDRDSIVVGDQVDMTLNVSYGKELQFSFPTLGDTLMPGIEIVRTSKIDTLHSEKSDDRVSVQRKYTLTSFDGNVKYTLPKIMFSLSRGIAADTFTSNELTLKVALPPMYNTLTPNDSTGGVDTTFTPNDIKPPVRYPITIVEALPYVIGGLLLLAIIVFAIYYLDRKRKNRPVFFKLKSKEPAHVIAIRALEKLKNEQLWQQGRIKDFHTKISEIIRVYIEDRYHIPAMEQTSEEILREFNSLNVCPKEHLELLHEMFTTSDLVKFAKHVPTPDENETTFQLTQGFVEKTKLVEQAPTGADVKNVAAQTAVPTEK
jgi:hypothetical protein